jgi:hypothetical protein
MGQSLTNRKTKKAVKNADQPVLIYGSKSSITITGKSKTGKKVFRFSLLPAKDKNPAYKYFSFE